jgi:hypothetical protein
VRGTGVLTVDNFVKIFGIGTIGWFQDYFPTCVINLLFALFRADICRSIAALQSLAAALAARDYKRCGQTGQLEHNCRENSA